MSGAATPGGAVCPFVLLGIRLGETLNFPQIFALAQMPFWEDLRLACVKGAPFRVIKHSEVEFTIDVFPPEGHPTHATLTLQPET